MDGLGQSVVRKGWVLGEDWEAHQVIEHMLKRHYSMATTGRR
jgi:hypothetical protein